MPVIKALIGGQWVEVGGSSGSGADEVFIGPTEPGLAAGYELWVDTDDDSGGGGGGGGAALAEGYFFSRMKGNTTTFGNNYIAMLPNAAWVGDGSWTVNANGLLASKAGIYHVHWLASISGSVGAFTLLKVSHFRANALLMESELYGGAPTATVATVAASAMGLFDIQVGDEVRLYARGDAVGRTQLGTQSFVSVIPIGPKA